MTAQLELAPAPPAWSRPARRGAPLLAVRIPIEPHPKERTGGNGRVRFTPPAYRDWLDRFCQSMHEYSPAQDREPISVPVLFEVTLVYPRPAKLPAFVNVKGVRVPVDQHDGRVHYLRAADYDNAIGAVFDGLVRARF
ncbi:MAG TPA: RusA family crossover junction endodeoxyribonuclease, partial [Kofleriaceae bacterium]|nr:RusA family crossover junction endodeoxyribonuclease [Kofleriaceae bacterium]